MHCVSSPPPPDRLVAGLSCYSCYFVALKKNEGMGPILDLKRLVATVDLKDKFFHIPVTKRHRKLLRFLFENIVCKLCVIPFVLY